MVIGELILLGKPSKLRVSDLRRTSIQTRGSRNTPCRFVLPTDTGISSGSFMPIGSKASLSEVTCGEIFYGRLLTLAGLRTKQSY